MVKKRKGEEMDEIETDPEVVDPPQSPADAELEQAVEEANLETTPRKSRRKLDIVVDEVIRGEWGSGQARRLRLSQAGIDHREVHAELVRRMNQQ